jgi:membrane protein required for colicin V production
VAVEGYDLVMIGLLAVAALLGYFKGMVWQLAWIAGIVASSFVALRFAPQFAHLFGQQAPWNRFLAMLALYVGTSLAVWILFRLVSGFINAIHLSAFDHQLGLLLGLAKGALLCIVITFFAVTLAPDYRHQIVASRSGRFVAELIVRADTYLPKEIHDTVEPFVDQFERQFAQPGVGSIDGPASASPQGGTFGVPAGQAAGQLAGGGLSFQTLIDGVSSAAAWAGSEQGSGAVHQAGGALPPGSAWFAPPAGTRSAPSSVPALPAPPALPAGFQPIAPAPVPEPPRPTGSRYSNPAPAGYPVGAQSPLPVR